MFFTHRSIRALTLALGATVTAITHGSPWSLAEHGKYQGEGPRVLIVHDMEGLSGQNSVESFFYQFDAYKHGQTLLAADLNAAIDGFFAGGAVSVHVTDGHGSGNPGPDLPPHLLDPRAKQLIRDSPFDPYLELPSEKNYDAIATVGAHARTGTRGFAAHTLTLGIDLHLNYTPVTETDFLGLSWGRYNIPLIFASGDDVLASQLAESMPWVKVAVTKYAIDAGNAKLRPVSEAREEIRRKAQLSIKSLTEARVMRIKEPITVTVRAVPPADLRPMKQVPGVDYSEPGITPQDAAVSFIAADWDSAMSGMFGLIAVARGGYLGHTIEQYEREGEHRKFDEFYERRMRVWVDQESDRLQPSPVINHGRPLPERYHGIR